MLLHASGSDEQSFFSFQSSGMFGIDFFLYANMTIFYVMGLLMNMISVNVTMGNRTFLLSQFRNSIDASITNVLPPRTPDSQHT